MKKFIPTFVLCIVMANAQVRPKSGWKTPMISWNDGEEPPISIEIEAHIISGTAALPGDYPWQAAVSITVPGGTRFCGGSLIDPSWVLTAAHCTTGGSAFSVRLGSVSPKSGGVVIAAKAGYTHAKYNPDYLRNDVALVKLNSPATLSSTIKVIPLFPTTLPSSYSILRVTGWGYTSDSTPQLSAMLLYTDVKVYTNAKCARVFGPSVVTSNTICTVGQPKNSPCRGDSGGPLTVTVGTKMYLVGVVSFGSSKGCEADFPSGYTRVEPFKPWITTITGLSL